LVAKIACSMLIVPTFVPVAVTAGAVGAAEGAAGRPDAGDAGAGDAAAVPVCAKAATEIANATAGRNLRNLLVIGSLVLLEKCSETYPNVLAATLGRATRSTWP
jgi:hypothetical protein